MHADLNVILPEILMSVYAIAALLGVAYTGQDRMAGMLVWLTSALFVVLAMWIGMSRYSESSIFLATWILSARVGCPLSPSLELCLPSFITASIPRKGSSQ